MNKSVLTCQFKLPFLLVINSLTYCENAYKIITVVDGNDR